jgi:hypothetical protein
MYCFVDLEIEFDSVAVVETSVVATSDAEDSVLFLHPEIIRDIHAITDGNHGRRKKTSA